MICRVEEIKDFKKNWFAVTLPIPSYSEDLVASFLVELTGTGVEFSDNGITAYLPLDDKLASNLLRINEFWQNLQKEKVVPGSFHWTSEIISDKDWAESWKSYFHPMRIGERIVIVPSWEQFYPRNNDIVISIDPGQAFGVGTHPTTRLCLEEIESFARNLRETGEKTWNFCDIGCGTGILAIAAVKLGAKKAVALDIDPVAVEVAKKNSIINHVEEFIHIRSGSLEEVQERFSCIAANIISKTIKEIAPVCRSKIKPNGRVILSGILKEEEKDVEAAYEDLKFTLERRVAFGEWRTLVFRASK